MYMYTLSFACHIRDKIFIVFNMFVHCNNEKLWISLWQMFDIICEIYSDREGISLSASTLRTLEARLLSMQYVVVNELNS